MAAISRIKLNKDNPDQLWWNFDQSGIFSVKSFYKIVKEFQMEVNNEVTGTKVWRRIAPPRVDVFQRFLL